MRRQCSALCLQICESHKISGPEAFGNGVIWHIKRGKMESVQMIPTQSISATAKASASFSLPHSGSLIICKFKICCLSAGEHATEYVDYVIFKFKQLH